MRVALVVYVCAWTRTRPLRAGLLFWRGPPDRGRSAPRSVYGNIQSPPMIGRCLSEGAALPNPAHPPNPWIGFLRYELRRERPSPRPNGARYARVPPTGRILGLDSWCMRWGLRATIRKRDR